MTLGININSKLKLIGRITSTFTCRKIRNSFFAWNGVSSESTSPSVLTRLNKTVVLPTVLYGCEMWTCLKSIDWSTLHKFQHFIVKHILGLKTLSRTDVCQGLLGLFPTDAYTDKKKLLFLHKLCEVKVCYLSKNILMIRLFRL